MFICVCVNICHVCAGAHGGQGRCWIPGAGVTGDFNMPDTGASNQIQGPLEELQALLTAEPSLQPWSKYY